MRSSPTPNVRYKARNRVMNFSFFPLLIIIRSQKAGEDYQMVFEEIFIEYLEQLLNTH